MRFMMMMFPKGYETAKPNVLPDLESIERMRKYNETLGQAGVLLALDGLKPPSAGARVSFAGGKPKVTDGPFAESKEAVGGFWIIDVKSREEAIEWAKRIPGSEIEVVEVRPFLEVSDFPTEVREALEEMERGATQPAVE
jgi:hypothetical protein